MTAMDARALLQRDPLHNFDMLHTLERPGGAALYAGAEGVVTDVDGYAGASFRDAEAAARLLPLCDGAEDLILHESVGVDAALARYGARYSTLMICHACVYERKTPVAYTLPPRAVIRPLTDAYAETVLAHYDGTESMEYIHGAIRRGMFGAFADGKLAGFIGTHESYTMGILEILPAYRRQGLGFALEAHLINHMLEKGFRRIYCHVWWNNVASLSLQRRLGLTVDPKPLYWFW